MSRKNDFFTRIDNFLNSLNQLNHKYNKIQQNEDISDSYRNLLLTETNLKIKELRKTANDDLLSIIDESIKDYQDKQNAITQQRLTNAGYQLGLQNVINAIKNNAFSYDEMQNIHAAYKKDPIALKSINDAVTSSGNTSIFPFSVPDVNATIKYLTDIKNNIERHVNNGYETDLGVSGIKYFIDTRLNDDMHVKED